MFWFTLLKGKIVWIAGALVGIIGYIAMLRKDNKISELHNEVNIAEAVSENEKLKNKVNEKVMKDERKVDVLNTKVADAADNIDKDKNEIEKDVGQVDNAKDGTDYEINI